MRSKITPVVALLALSVVVTACGSDSAATTQPSSGSTSALTASSPSTSSPSTSSASTETAAVTVASTADPVQIDPQAALTQAVDSAFDPPFSLQIPADWTAVLRDRWAFQAYAGNEDFEITFDHTYQEKESVDEGIARLAATAGLNAGPVGPVAVGGVSGKGFVGDSQSAVRFVDSGFHTNDASRLEVIVIPMEDGTTVTVFLTAGADRQGGVDALGQLARRVFETVRWK